MTDANSIAAGGCYDPGDRNPKLPLPWPPSEPEPTVLDEKVNWLTYSHQELYDMVWGGQMAYRDRSVDVFVRKVRRKLAEVSPEWVYIHTHFGIGYRMSIEPAPATGADLTPATP